MVAVVKFLGESRHLQCEVERLNGIGVLAESSGKRKPPGHKEIIWLEEYEPPSRRLLKKINIDGRQTERR